MTDLTIISYFTIDLVSAILPLERASKIDQTVPDCLGWFLYDSTKATVTSLPNWRTKVLERGLCKDELLGVVHAKATSPYNDKFGSAGKNEKLA